METLAHVDTMYRTRYLGSMAHRTTVNVFLTPEFGAFLQSRVQSGRAQTTGEVVREALRLLEQHERERESGLKQLKRNSLVAQLRRNAVNYLMAKRSSKSFGS